jgi:protein arginine kinase activator
MFRSCDRCENPATVHLTEIRAGKKTERHLCENCARELQVPYASKELQKLLQTFGPAKGPRSTQGRATRACPECGMTFNEFRQTGRFGCAKDYEAFGEEVERLLSRIHGASKYTGRSPQGQTIEEGLVLDELAKTREALRRAIDAEDYEEAARLRDAIRAIDAGRPDDGGGDVE